MAARTVAEAEYLDTLRQRHRRAAADRVLADVRHARQMRLAAACYLVVAAALTLLVIIVSN